MSPPGCGERPPLARGGVEGLFSHALPSTRGSTPGPEAVVCIPPPAPHRNMPPPRDGVMGRDALGRVWAVFAPPAASALPGCVRICLLLFFHRERAASSSTGRLRGAQGALSPGPPPLLPLTHGLPLPQQGQQLSVRAFSHGCRDRRGLLAVSTAARSSVKKPPPVYSTLSCFYFWRRRS